MNALTAAMPELAAEEQLAAISAASSPHMRKEDRHDLIGSLERATGEGGRSGKRLRGEAALANLERLGFHVTRLPQPGTRSDEKETP